MKIKRISEKLIGDISSEKVEEILSSLKKICSNIEEGKKDIDNINNILSKFSNPKSKNNDQIDDSVVNFKKIINDLQSVIDVIDNTSQNLENYRDNGRKYIY